ncbi:hypothetical protein B0T16DRAFT_454159 [Cercophora newfieldiana]|uniref:SAP domain-containing protein n=1 Tax=Cercophora newfieldiana TaxID=92897 RepID=A0AA39YGZ0_9PEZI|nr:hypothetical protein B0T16DRAFT_454159 [Cercophora newfieldiana]
MADYNSMKVPELKKLLNERGLTQAGNKADLIARLVENDKEQAKASDPKAESGKKDNIEDEIDYEDDDFPATTAQTKPAAAAPATAPTPAAPAPVAAPAKTTAPETETVTPAAPAPAADAPTESADKKTETATSGEPLFSQHLAPTNAKSEAEKRAARAARFGITEDKESEESKKTERAARFGIANDAVSALDSALPDRPRKRGRDRGGEDKEDDSRSNKRQTSGAAPARGGRNNAGRGNNQSNNRSGRRDRRGGASKEGGVPNGQKKATPAIDPAEKARLEARAKRFGTA